MGLKVAAAALCGFLTLGVCAAPAAGGIVARTDYDVSQRWELPKFLGKDFYPKLIWWGLISRDGPLTGKYEVYRTCAFSCLSRRAEGVDGPFQGPYAFSDFFARLRPETRGWLFGTNDLSRPITLSFDGVRMEWNLAEKYPLADRASFEEWRSAHPNFYAHQALIEFDCECIGYPAYFRKADAEKMKRLESAYPATFADYAQDVNFRDGWVKTAVDRACEYAFGCKDIVTMSYWCPGYQILMADAGSKSVCFEATGSASAACWAIGAAYMRGAARLYRRSSWWYTANVYGGFTRDGKRREGENRRLGGPDDMFNRKKGWWGPNNGLSRSLVAWQNVYGWLQGAMFVEPENALHYHLELAEDGKTQRASAFAKDFDDLNRLAQKVDRGIPYTPYALLLPASERVTIQGIPEFHRYMEFSRTAAIHTLQPIRNDRKLGIQGSFYNSEFGECWDITCPDIRSPEDTSEALAPYKAAVLLGVYRKKSPKQALRRYVENGGTLFVSCDHVRRNNVGVEMAGVRFAGGRAKVSGKVLVDEAGMRRPLKGAYVLETGEVTTGKVLWRDEAGTPVAWINDFGKGRVVTIASVGMLPYGVNEPGNLENEGEFIGVVKKIRQDELTFELMKLVFERLQGETLPVHVAGDVQWGVNRTKRGWLVWLYNNKGVTHFFGEPEEFDFSKTASVTISAKGFKPVAVRDAETGKAIPGAVDVKPGQWRLVELEAKGVQ